MWIYGEGRPEAIASCKNGTKVMVREGLPLAAIRAEIRGRRVAVGCYCELSKDGRGEERRLAVVFCRELPASGGDGGKGLGCCELSWFAKEWRMRMGCQPSMDHGYGGWEWVWWIIGMGYYVVPFSSAGGCCPGGGAVE
jgi:hypothetical protein